MKNNKKQERKRVQQKGPKQSSDKKDMRATGKIEIRDYNSGNANIPKPTGRVYVLTPPKKNYGSMFDRIYALTGEKFVGILNKNIDRGSVYMHKGQCVMVYHTESPGIVTIATNDGRRANVEPCDVERMQFQAKK